MKRIIMIKIQYISLVELKLSTQLQKFNFGTFTKEYIINT